MIYTTIKGFVGMVGHYRHFIKDFAKIADTLYKYARGDVVKRKKERVVLNEAARKAFHERTFSGLSRPQQGVLD